MGRPKKLQAVIMKQTAQQNNIINNAVEALQANRGGQTEESVVLSPEDFEPLKQPVKSKQETEEENTIAVAPGEAERLRRLAQIKESRYGIDSEQKAEAIKENKAQEERILTELKASQDVNLKREKLAEQNKPAKSKMTIEHYKVLKTNERFWLPFKNHGVLNGLNAGELDALTDTMRRVFDPNYNVDIWCSYCVGEFIKDLYTYFEKWQIEQKTEVEEYDTILKADEF